MKIGQDEVIPSSEKHAFGIHLKPETLASTKPILVAFLTGLFKVMLGRECVLVFEGAPSMRKKHVEIAADYIKASRESAQGQTEADIRAFLRGNPQSALNDAEINEAFKRAGPRQTPEPAPWMPMWIRQRYFRPVIAHPKGAVVHDGDCHVFSSKICTCGLLHMLARIGTERSSGVDTIYPKFYDEYVEHDTALHEATNNRLYSEDKKEVADA